MKKYSKKPTSKKATYESSYRDYNYINNIVRHGLETALRIQEKNLALNTK